MVIIVLYNNASYYNYDIIIYIKLNVFHTFSGQSSGRRRRSTDNVLTRSRRSTDCPSYSDAEGLDASQVLV